ncbi:ABC transporter ATP-binding protein [Rhodalgimonas zhirmunskyi]|uniref:ABC transporter ATP-binding protein n=1 Tax=Rhodalgimonas zhirmunskyi TaxID=2964767 RepID=A0AAJ1U4M9_9RHOB|nr:ABC transporter ATP-binding protein [Rhodoalgimonas zhirmunskyi]MDQ2093616.1 ABC transporter ATP-binding protein [Rhodoalgimonas zhirmunskyi]
MTHLLEAKSLDAFYGDFQALFGVEFHVDQGESVALIGANGAGKTTFLKVLTGLLPVPGQSLSLEGVDLTALRIHQIAARGIAMSPEGRRLFPSLSVRENLQIGASVKRPGPWSLETVEKLFPILAEKANTPSTLLSGGQQQMVAIGRALMANPKLLLLDEVSLGLAPVIVRDIYETLPMIREQGTSVILVEQDIGQAVAVSDRLYCLQEGRISLEGKSSELGRDEISAAYFGRAREAS